MFKTPSFKEDGLDRRLCVAPMMDWTDRHCRYFHRLLSPNALLFTEMVFRPLGRITSQAQRIDDFERMKGIIHFPNKDEELDQWAEEISQSIL